MENRFYLTVFGGLALRGVGSPLGSTIGKRRLALLCTLAVSGELGLSRDLLTALFWPESDDAHARGALKQAIYSLRTELGAGAIQATPTGYALSPTDVGSDLQDFRYALEAGELDRAVAIYAGPFLAGVHLGGADGLEQWSDSVRRELEADYRHALQALLTDGTQRSAEQRVAWAEQLLVLDRADARAAEHLVRTLADAGRMGQARRTADEYERWVREELGGDPDPAVAAAAGPAEGKAAPPDPEGPAHVAVGAERTDLALVATQTSSTSRTDPRAPRVSVTGRLGRTRTAVVLGTLALVALGASRLPQWPTEEARELRAQHPRAQRPAALAKHPVHLSVSTLPGHSTLAPAAQVLREALATAIPRVPAFLGVFPAPDDSLRLARLPGEAATTAPFDVTVRLSLVGDSVMVFLRASSRADPVLATRATLALGTRLDPLARLDDTVERLLGALALRSDSDSTKTLVTRPPPRYDSYSRWKAGYQLLRSDWDPARLVPFFEAAYRLDKAWFPPVRHAVNAYDAMEEFHKGDSLVADARRRMAALPDLQQELESFARFRAESRASIGPASLPPVRMLLTPDPAATCGQRLSSATEYYLAGRPAEAALLLADLDDACGRTGAIDGFAYWVRGLSLHSSGQYALEMELARSRFEHPASGISHREYFDYIRAMAATGTSSGVLARLHGLPGDVVEREQYVMHTFTLAGEVAFHGDPIVARTLFDLVAETCELRVRRLEHYRHYCALANIASGDTVAARAWVARLAQEDIDPLVLLGLRGMLSASAGHVAEARAVLDEISLYQDDRRYGRPDFWRARILAVLGDSEGAITALADASAGGWFPFWGYYGYFHWYPELARLKDDPRVRSYWIIDGPAH